MSNKPKQRNQSNPPTQITVEQQQYYTGLIPPPQMMEQYKNVLPSLPEKLVDWVEQESKHRRRMEHKIINRGTLIDLSRTVAGLIALAGITIVGYLFMKEGHPTQGAAIITGVVVSAAGIFVTRTYKQSKEK